MSTIHLYVMELEGDGQVDFEPMLAVFAPHHHWVTELVCVLIYDAVKFGGYHG